MDPVLSQAGEQTAELSGLSGLPTVTPTSSICSPASDIEAWLEAACADSTNVWWHEDLQSPADLPAARAAELLCNCSSFSQPEEDENHVPQQVFGVLGRNPPQLSQHMSPISTLTPPQLSPANSDYGAAGGGLGGVSRSPSGENSNQSYSHTEELEHSCGGSTASQDRPATDNAFSPTHRPALRLSSSQALARRESQPYSTASARGAAVPSETVITSEDELAREVHSSPDALDDASDFEMPDDVAQVLGASALATIPATAEDPDLVDSDDPQHSDDDFQEEVDSQEDSSDLESGQDLHFCVNCTNRVYGDSYCGVCHWPMEEEAQFFSNAHAAERSSACRPSASGPTALVWDERMQLHCEGMSRPHPERPDRIKAVMARLLSSNIADRCQRLPCREATAAEVAAAHRPDLYARVEAASTRASTLMLGRPQTEDDGADSSAPASCVYFSSDTYANPSTSTCARLAAGASVDIAVAVATGQAAAGAAIVRPPGHHAESATPMGFCFFNNAAVAAQAARSAGARRVIILDFDVHHGNGTQHIFESDPSVMYMSVHRYDGGHFYPGTGSAQEVGIGAGEGFTVNVPWAMCDMGDADYLAAFTHVFLPIAYEYSPDMIIISAGYDAAKGDPMGGCRVSSAGFGHMTALLGAVAPLAVILEGGYNLDATAAGVEATMRVLLGERPVPLPANTLPTSRIAMAVIREVISVQSRYWRCLQGLIHHPHQELHAPRWHTPQHPSARIPGPQPHAHTAPQPHVQPHAGEQNDPVAHMTFSESAAAAKGTGIDARGAAESGQEARQGSRTDMGSTVKGLVEIRLPSSSRPGSAEASSPTRLAADGRTHRHDWRLARLKQQLASYEGGKRQRRMSISNEVHQYKRRKLPQHVVS